MFNTKEIQKAKKHAEREYPARESCGLIINDKYHPVLNVAINPKDDFMIDLEDYLKAEKIGNIQAVIHSHHNNPHASYMDMESQLNCEIPFGIINIDKSGRAEKPFFWGEEVPIPKYIGRKFILGVQDCYSLARNFYKQEYNIYLKEYPRDAKWWVTGPSILLDNYKENNFYEINSKELKIGDVVLMKINSKIVNHCAIVVDNNIILHHLGYKLSCRHPLNYWTKHIVKCIRHKDINQ